MSQAFQGQGRDRTKSNVFNKNGAPKKEKPKYFQPFVPDIDNFAGVKNLKNFCIIALKDNGYGLGERSVGVIQL